MYIVSKWLHKIKSHQIGDSKTILMNFHENENISFTALLKNKKKGLMQCLLPAKQKKRTNAMSASRGLP